MPEDLRQMVYRKLSERGLEYLWNLIDYIITNESGWNPSQQSNVINASGQRENSWGLFQLLIDSPQGPGLGGGYTSEELVNPELNTDVALDHIEGQLGAGILLQQAVDDWTVTHNIDANQYLQGGATMPDGQVGTATATGFPGGTPIPQWFIDMKGAEWETLKAQVERMQGDPGGRGMAGYARPVVAEVKLGNREDYIFKEFLTWYQMAPGLFPEVGQLPPTAQEVAISQANLDNLAHLAEMDIAEFGWDVATQNFQNGLDQLQKGTELATWAQDYAQQIAPPGVTTMPGLGPESYRSQLGEKLGYAPREPVPLPLAPAASPWEALGQTEQYLPSMPEMPSMMPQGMGVSNLAALGAPAPAMPQAPMGVQNVGMGPTPDMIVAEQGLGMPAGGDADRVASMSEILQQVLQQLFGGMFPGPSMTPSAAPASPSSTIVPEPGMSIPSWIPGVPAISW